MIAIEALAKCDCCGEPTDYTPQPDVVFLCNLCFFVKLSHEILGDHE